MIGIKLFSIGILYNNQTEEFQILLDQPLKA